MTSSIYEDLRKLEENPDSFPRDFATSSLKEIVSNDELDSFLKLQAQQELTIREYGIQIYGIFPTNNEDGPGFSYSVGCSRVGLPEMLSFYPSYQSNHFVMNKIYQRMLDLDIVPPTEPGEVLMIDDVLANGLQVAMVLLNQEQREAAYKEFTCQCESNEVPVVQILLPLPNGNWITSMIPDEYQFDLPQSGDEIEAS